MSDTLNDLKPIHFPGVTAVMGAPETWDERNGPCVGLPVMKKDGFYISLWQITFWQRVRLLFGAPLWLWVVGSQPPVMLTIGEDKS